MQNAVTSSSRVIEIIDALRETTGEARFREFLRKAPLLDETQKVLLNNPVRITIQHRIKGYVDPAITYPSSEQESFAIQLETTIQTLANRNITVSDLKSEFGWRYEAIDALVVTMQVLHTNKYIKDGGLGERSLSIVKNNEMPDAIEIKHSHNQLINSASNDLLALLIAEFLIAFGERVEVYHAVFLEMQKLISAEKLECLNRINYAN